MDCSALFESLGVDDPPVVTVASSDQFAGWAKGGNEIGLNQDLVMQGRFFGTLVHELAHILLFRSGAREEWHGPAFMALVAVLLLRSGFNKAGVHLELGRLYRSDWNPLMSAPLRRLACRRAQAIYSRLRRLDSLPAPAVAAEAARLAGRWESRFWAAPTHHRSGSLPWPVRLVGLVAGLSPRLRGWPRGVLYTRWGSVVCRKP